MKSDLNTCTARKEFRGPKSGRFPELEQVVEFVQEKRNEGFPITREIIKMEALELQKRNMKAGSATEFMASAGWCVRMMKRAGIVLRRRTTLCQRLPSAYEEKLVFFQRLVIGLRKQHEYLLDHMGNADQTPVFFDMPTSVVVDVKDVKSVLVRSTGNEKARITVMLCTLADGRKMPPFVILRRKTMPKEKVPAGLVIRAQEKECMTK